MGSMSEAGDRLFAVVDPRTRHTTGFCAGPRPAGECPRQVAGQPLPCAGHRVIPLSRTQADGLPFMVDAEASGRCPLAWLDGADPEDGMATATDGEGWLPPAGPQTWSIRSAS
jgi:hypothetical protein